MKLEQHFFFAKKKKKTKLKSTFIYVSHSYVCVTAGFINCFTDLMVKNSTIYVSDHTYRFPCNTSRARLGWTPSAVLQNLRDEPQTYVRQRRGSHGFIKWILWAHGGFGGKRKHIPLSSASPGYIPVAAQAGLEAVAPGPLCSRTAGHRCLPCGCCTQLLTSCMPVSETQNFTSDDLRQHTTLLISFQKTSVPNIDPRGLESLLECLEMTFRTNSHRLP